MSNACLGYKQLHSVLVVANKGIFKMINTVEVKIHSSSFRIFIYYFGKNCYFTVTVF